MTIYHRVVKDDRPAWEGMGIPSWRCDGKAVGGGPWGVINMKGEYVNSEPFSDKRDAIHCRAAKTRDINKNRTHISATLFSYNQRTFTFTTLRRHLGHLLSTAFCGQLPHLEKFTIIDAHGGEIEFAQHHSEYRWGDLQRTWFYSTNPTGYKALVKVKR
jgi:hypothetical protein